jgi:hypothetical protein
MKKHTVVFLALVLLLPLAFNSLCAQEEYAGENHPRDIEKWRFVLNGSFEVFHPYNVVKADNNWKIILACLPGITRDQLKENGIRFTESQLMLLRGMQFIKEEDNTLRTILPILGDAQMRIIRQAARELATKLEPQLQNEIVGLIEKLKKAGYESNIFALLFSIGLDNVPFYYAVQKGLVREEQLSTEGYLWSGQFYAYYPPREIRCGTNSYGENGVYACLNWSDKPWDKIKKYFSSKNLTALSGEYRKNGKITDENLRRSLAETNIFDEEGNLTVPILTKKGDGPLYTSCYNIREKAGTLFVDNVRFRSLMQKCNLHDEVTAMAVFYHEWEWELIALLEERGLIKRPLIFTHPEEASPKEIGALLFIVDSRE